MPTMSSSEAGSILRSASSIETVLIASPPVTPCFPRMSFYPGPNVGLLTLLRGTLARRRRWAGQGGEKAPETPVLAEANAGQGRVTWKVDVSDDGTAGPAAARIR